MRRAPHRADLAVGRLATCSDFGVGIGHDGRSAVVRTRPLEASGRGSTARGSEAA